MNNIYVQFFNANPIALTIVLLLPVLLTACVSGGGTRTTELQPATTVPTAASSSVKQDFQSALKLMKDKKYADAVELLNTINTRNNRLAGVHANLGIAYVHLNKPEEAVTALKRAAELKSTDVAILNELGIAYRHNGQFVEARDVYQQLLAQDPMYGQAHLNMGILCDLYIQDLGCALQHYEAYQLLQTQPDEKVTLWIADLKSRMAAEGGQ